MKRSANRKNSQRGCYHRLQGCYVGLAIFCILSAILVPNFLRARKQGQYTSCKSNLRDIQIGIEMYQEDHEGAMPSNLQALVPGYLRRIPRCPSAEAVTYFATFGPRAPFNERGDEEYSLVECMGHHHEIGARSPNHPKCTSIVGLMVKNP